MHKLTIENKVFTVNKDKANIILLNDKTNIFILYVLIENEEFKNRDNIYDFKKIQYEEEFHLFPKKKATNLGFHVELEDNVYSLYFKTHHVYYLKHNGNIQLNNPYFRPILNGGSIRGGAKSDDWDEEEKISTPIDNIPVSKEKIIASLSVPPKSIHSFEPPKISLVIESYEKKEEREDVIMTVLSENRTNTTATTEFINKLFEKDNKELIKELLNHSKNGNLENIYKIDGEKSDPEYEHQESAPGQPIRESEPQPEPEPESEPEPEPEPEPILCESEPEPILCESEPEPILCESEPEPILCESILCKPEQTIRTSDPNETIPASDPNETIPASNPNETIPASNPNETIPASDPDETIRTSNPNETIRTSDPNETIRTSNPDGTIRTSPYPNFKPLIDPFNTPQTISSFGKQITNITKQIEKIEKNKNSVISPPDTTYYKIIQYQNTSYRIRVLKLIESHNLNIHTIYQQEIHPNNIIPKSSPPSSFELNADLNVNSSYLILFMGKKIMINKIDSKILITDLTLKKGDIYKINDRIKINDQYFLIYSSSLLVPLSEKTFYNNLNGISYKTYLPTLN